MTRVGFSLLLRDGLHTLFDLDLDLVKKESLIKYTLVMTANLSITTSYHDCARSSSTYGRNAYIALLHEQ